MQKNNVVNEKGFYIIEKFYDDEKESILKSNIKSGKLKVNSVIRIPTSSVYIFMIKGNELLGFISASLYDDNNASLMMSGIRSVELPPELESLRSYIEFYDVALLVNEKYMNQGYGKDLIKQLLDYLAKRGIVNLEVYGITNNVAMSKYIPDFSEKIDSKTSIYRNIENIVSSLEVKNALRK